jgi:hypothetical protein
MLQQGIFSQWGYSTTKHSVSKEIPAQNIQPVRTFQQDMFSQ